MTEFTDTDARYMARALTLARRGRYTAHPNPQVGCVIVRDGSVVGEGWHAAAGEAHAEVHALEAAGGAAAGATVYVSLEPCAHHGRTAPCVDALIEARVGRVVVAVGDPYPEVSGQGIAALEAAGIETATGLMAAPARRINEGFFSRVARGRPFVRVKVATSLDGATAMADGESRWITGPASRQDVQRLRAASGAILTGIGTVLADDPSLTVREPGLVRRQPLRAVADSNLQMPPAARMLALDGETVVYCIDDARREPLERAGAEVVRLPEAATRVDPASILSDLGNRGINDLLVEAGPALAGALVEQGLADELVIYQAPHIMGSETRPAFSTPAWSALGDRLELDIEDMRRIGPDLRIVARPRG